jgi:hypothetical protein
MNSLLPVQNHHNKNPWNEKSEPHDYGSLFYKKPKIKLPEPHSQRDDRERDRIQQRLQLVQTKCHPYRDLRSCLGENVYHAGELEFRLH